MNEQKKPAPTPNRILALVRSQKEAGLPCTVSDVYIRFSHTEYKDINLAIDDLVRSHCLRKDGSGEEYQKTLTLQPAGLERLLQEEFRQAELHEAIRANNAHEAKVKELQEANRTAQSELQAVIQANELAKEQVSVLESQVSTLKKQNDSLEKQNDSLEKQTLSLEKQTVALNDQNDSLKEQAASLKDQNDTLMEQAVALQAQVASIDAINDQLKAEAAARSKDDKKYFWLGALTSLLISLTVALISSWL